LITGKCDDDRYFKTGIATVVRKESTTLAKTAVRDREDAISSAWCLFLLNKKHRNKQLNTYEYAGRMVEFMGADDEQKIRGGKRDILYCNEANSLNFNKEFFQLFIRTTYKTFIDFNPDNEDVRINIELEQKRQFEEWDVEVIVSTYKDNPFLPESMVKEIERLEKTNPSYWRIYGLGEYGKLEGVVFDNRGICETVPEYCKLLGYWLDFWFTNDPTALIAVYKGDSSIFIDEIIYERWLTNQDIDAMIVGWWIDKRETFIGDCAEPKSIEELYRRHWNIRPCKKWKDSIKYGIDLMKQAKIMITAQSINTIREFKWYCRQQNKNGELDNEKTVGSDHSLDAIRYLFMDLFDTRQPVKERVVKDTRMIRDYRTGKLVPRR
jgi:phage terminase large subunit